MAGRGKRAAVCWLRSSEQANSLCSHAWYLPIQEVAVRKLGTWIRQRCCRTPGPSPPICLLSTRTGRRFKECLTSWLFGLEILSISFSSFPKTYLLQSRQPNPSMTFSKPVKNCFSNSRLLLWWRTSTDTYGGVVEDGYPISIVRPDGVVGGIVKSGEDVERYTKGIPGGVN